MAVADLRGTRPIRIAYVSEGYPPMINGPAFVVGDLAQGMSGRGVDTHYFGSQRAVPQESKTLLRQYELDTQPPVILHVGRSDPDKRVEMVVQAAARVKGETPAQLLLVGDGSRRAAAQRLCHDLRIADRTCSTGYVFRDSDLPHLYRLASAFVNLSKIETQCLAALEALMSAEPVMREMVQDGVNDLLVPADNLDAVVQRLFYLLCDPYRASKMGRTGRSIVERQSVSRMLDLHEELYRSLLLESSAQTLEAS